MMSDGLNLTENEIARLKQFHAEHFTSQEVPSLALFSTSKPLTEKPERDEDEGDDLGYYEDGIKRTLTDEQIAMFRNSEIQRLLAARRREREREERQIEKETRRQERRNREVQNGSAYFDRNRRVFDHAAEHQVQSLTYDDEPDSTSEAKTFKWPNLGG